MTEQELPVFLNTKTSDFAHHHGVIGYVVELDETLCNTPTYRDISKRVEVSCEILFNDIVRKAKEEGKPARAQFFALREMLLTHLRAMPEVRMGDPKGFRVYVKLGFIDRTIAEIDRAPTLWQQRLDDFVAL